jgi:opacity protein-like surface antigen
MSMATVRRSLLATIAALAVVAAPAATHAADTYLALKGGVWAPTASDGFNSAGDALNGKFPASGNVELAYGATMGIIGAQIAGGYMWSTQTITDGTNSATVKANAVPLYALGQLRLPIFFIQPYLELGIGVLANFASASGVGESFSSTKFSFLVVGGAGVDFILGPILLGAEARYMYVTPQTLDWGGGAQTMKLSGVNITANVGYVF